MRSESIAVENMKCGGCASTIKKALMEMDGVELVDVDVDHGHIEASVQDVVLREDLLARLARLGYPEAGKGNLLQKGISYVSCMIGKLGEVKNEKGV